jgi:hypothetical protein
MASEAPPPAYSASGSEPPTEDAAPTYNDATGTLDVYQDGLSAQTQVRSQ